MKKLITLFGVMLVGVICCESPTEPKQNEILSYELLVKISHRDTKEPYNDLLVKAYWSVKNNPKYEEIKYTGDTLRYSLVLYAKKNLSTYIGTKRIRFGEKDTIYKSI